MGAPSPDALPSSSRLARACPVVAVGLQGPRCVGAFDVSACVTLAIDLWLEEVNVAEFGGTCEKALPKEVSTGRVTVAILQTVDSTSTISQARGLFSQFP